MQLSLRRMLLAVAIFAAILGTFSLYAKRAVMLRTNSDLAWWRVDVAMTASAIGGIVLVGRRRDHTFIKDELGEQLRSSALFSARPLQP